MAKELFEMLGFKLVYDDGKIIIYEKNDIYILFDKIEKTYEMSISMLVCSNKEFKLFKRAVNRQLEELNIYG